MKATFLAVLLLGAIIGRASAQGEPAPLCLRAVDVDHTKVPNDRTILFYMKDGKVWSTTLRSNCPQLRFNGFEYGPSPPGNICANLQTIRVLNSRAVCEIGWLTPANR